jgi:hypothetical protein
MVTALVSVSASRLSATQARVDITQVFDLVSTILITLACRWGLGKHQNALSYQQKFHAEKLNRIDEAFLVFAPMFARISVAVLVLSILGTTRNWARWLLYTISMSIQTSDRSLLILYHTVAIQVIENIIIVVQAWAQCHNHPSALWDSSINAEKYCDSHMFEVAMAYLSSGFNSLSDLILTALPAFILLRLDMRMKTKVALVAVFALGLVSVPPHSLSVETRTLIRIV